MQRKHETSLFPRLQQLRGGHGDREVHLHHRIKDCKRRGPHQRYELCCGGRDERPSGLNSRMHARGLRFEAKLRVWGGKRIGVNRNDYLDLFDRGLYDVDEGLQLGQGTLGYGSESNVKHLSVKVPVRQTLPQDLDRGSSLAVRTR